MLTRKFSDAHSLIGFHKSLDRTNGKLETFNVKCYPQRLTEEVVIYVVGWCQEIEEYRVIEKDCRYYKLLLF